MSAHRFIVWMFALSLVGCSSTRVVRLDSGQGTPAVHVPFEEEDTGPVELDDDEFEVALVVLARDVTPFEHPLREARERFGVPERSGVYEYQPQSLRLIPRGDEDIEGPRLVWRVLDGWVVLVREADRARSFEELSAAGEAYGEVLGENAARVFVMLATAAIGSTAGLAAKASGLPGSAQAGYRYMAVGGVRSVAMSAEGFTVALAPHAVAMASSESRSGRIEKHHLATNKNSKSAARGGPWTPRFRDLFKKAGMELKDPENIVAVPGHKGPHPEAYHMAVHERLRDATRSCRTVVACRESLTAALKDLAAEVSTRGTKLHRLVTEGK